MLVRTVKESDMGNLISEIFVPCQYNETVHSNTEKSFSADIVNQDEENGEEEEEDEEDGENEDVEGDDSTTSRRGRYSFLPSETRMICDNLKVFIETPSEKVTDKILKDYISKCGNERFIKFVDDISISRIRTKVFTERRKKTAGRCKRRKDAINNQFFGYYVYFSIVYFLDTFNIEETINIEENIRNFLFFFYIFMN